MMDYEDHLPPEPTPQQASRSDDYPEPPDEPEPPQEPDEPTPPADSAAEEIDGLNEPRREGTPDRDKSLAELISDQLGIIDGTTGLTHKQIGELATKLAELTAPTPNGQGDPLQPTMDKILDMLIQLGERMTTLDRRMTALESRQHKGEHWATFYGWCMTGLIDGLGVKPSPPPQIDYTRGRIDFSAIEPPLPPSAD